MKEYEAPVIEIEEFEVEQVMNEGSGLQTPGMPW
jgi:hypothetical protein